MGTARSGGALAQLEAAFESLGKVIPFFLEPDIASKELDRAEGRQEEQKNQDAEKWYLQRGGERMDPIEGRDDLGVEQDPEESRHKARDQLERRRNTLRRFFGFVGPFDGWIA